ncbi:MAG: hypothetical protein FWH01_09490 [Oscillospiraceae bacterium]|nr:hypothetical protein [Oscillospiraceae bacterium]
MPKVRIGPTILGSNVKTGLMVVTGSNGPNPEADDEITDEPATANGGGEVKGAGGTAGAAGVDGAGGAAGASGAAGAGGADRAAGTVGASGAAAEPADRPTAVSGNAANMPNASAATNKNESSLFDVYVDLRFMGNLQI